MMHRDDRDGTAKLNTACEEVQYGSLTVVHI